jgi:hypothetical protein
MSLLELQGLQVAGSPDGADDNPDDSNLSVTACDSAASITITICI